MNYYCFKQNKNIMSKPLEEVDTSSYGEVTDAISYMRYNLVNAERCSSREEFIDMSCYLELARKFVARAVADPTFGLSGSKSVMEVVTVILPRYIRSFYELNADWVE
jgi:hypothetical protein